MRTLGIILFLACSLHGHGSPPDELNRQMKAIAQVESNNNHQKVNKETDAVGWLQIRKPMVNEANRILGVKRFKYKDRYCKKKQKEIFRIVIRHHNPSLNLRTTCKIWNGGTKNRIVPKWYLSKVLSMYKKHA